MTHPNSHEYKRGVVLYNPTKVSTKAFKRGQRQVEFLAATFGLPLESLATDPDSLRTQEKMLELLTAHDLLMVLGGDGTINTAVHALVRQDKDHRADLLAVPVGTANDFSRNRNGRLRSEDALVKVLERGGLVDIHPMAITVQSPDDELERVGVNNAGFHYTANFAELLNGKPHREGSARQIPLAGMPVQDAITMHQSMRDLTTVPIYADGSIEPIHISDVMLVHAQKAAKHGKFNSSHLSDDFRYIPSTDATKPAILKAGARMLIGGYNGEPRAQLNFKTGESPMLGHVDGETFPVAPQSSVNVRLSDESFRAHSLNSKT